MQRQNIQYNYPFGLIAGKGLGTRYSSLDKIGGLFPREGFGAAKILFYPNIVTGNLVLLDHMLPIQELGGEIQIGYTYNSQAVKPSPLWQFTLKQFVQLSPADKTAVLKEADGHFTTYIFDAHTEIYNAPADADNGIAKLRFDKAKQQWERVQPLNNLTEIFNVQGLLIKQIDISGREIAYEYNASQQLTAIAGKSGCRYELRRGNNNTTIDIYLTGSDCDAKLLKIYQFDSEGRLSFSETPDGYRTSYQYGISNDGWKLFFVTQTDKTLLKFGYDDSRRLSTFNLGTKSVFRLQYADIQHQQFTLTDAYKGITSISMNANADITEVSRSQGFNTVLKEVDTTKYSYTQQYQLASIIHPNGGKEEFTYNDSSGLQQTHTEPDGQKSESVYQVDQEKIRLIGVIQYENTNDIPLVTRHVYDNDYNRNHIFLRFKITPQGRVTEYRPDSYGNIGSLRKYLGNIYDLSHLDPRKSPSLAEMLQWVSRQDRQQITLTEFAYNPRGQLLRTHTYANVDKNGNGIRDEQMGEIFTFPNLYGNWFTTQVKQNNESKNNVAITKRTLDDLQRVISETDALQQTTTWEYLDAQAQVKITRPNGRVDLKQKSDRGLVEQVQESVNQQTRITKYGRDTNGRIALITRPDAQFVYPFYDHQDRLGYEVTTSGIVTEYLHDLEHRYQAETRYATAIDPAKLFLKYPPLPGFLPEIGKLIQMVAAIKDPIKDRTSYRFQDRSSRLRYRVDADKYITQYFYDKRDHKIAEITWHTQLTVEQLTKLKSGDDLTLTPDFTKDRCTRYFYDQDGMLIGTQDAAGYVTEYVRNNGEEISQKIQYGTKMPIDLSIGDFNKVRPKASIQDAKYFYFYNARLEVIAELSPGNIQGEYYFTQHQYYPNGLKQKSINYATIITTVSPVPPQPAPAKDHITHYQYDLLERALETILPNQKAENLKYDIAGHPVFQQSRDLQNPDNIKPDYQRSTSSAFDGWEQKINDINVFGGEITHHFDSVTGLKTHTTDALKRTTYYFYDIDKRVVASIDPAGGITENELNTFGEILQTTRYANKIPGKITEGGYLTPEIQKLFVSDPVHDQIIQFKYDLRGEMTSKIDAKGYISQFEYNAFREMVAEKLPVETAEPTLLKEHGFDVRGLEILTRVSAPNTPSELTVRLYENYFGKESGRIDARNGIYRMNYELRGLLRELIKDDGVSLASQQFAYNAFGQIQTEKDALGKITTHDYDILKRHHIIEYPVAGVKETFTQNIFDETVQHQDALNHVETWQHAANGQVHVYTDALQQTNIQDYDLAGQLTSMTNADHVRTTMDYDSAGYLSVMIQDETGSKFKTSYERDAFGNPVRVTDPRNVFTDNTFDQGNLLIESISDMKDQGLNLIVSNQYNAQKSRISETRGDKSNPKQYQETFQIDGRNRPTGNTIDPEGLQITTAKHLDAAGDVIAIIDANGNITRKFYDTLGRLRFIADAEGGIAESSYDKDDRLLYTRVYELAIDPGQLNDQTTLKQFMQMVKADAADTLNYYFYDADGNERFQVNGLGQVAERQYNLAQREIKSIKYATPVDPKKLPGLTTEQLMALIVPNPEDRIVYQILDAKYQQRFVIDTEEYLSEKRFDANGNVIATIKYATQLSDPEKIAGLPPEKVLENINLDPVNDRAVFTVFDAMNNPQYLVDAESAVTQYWHDENNNLTQTCVYKNKINIPANYQELIALLKKLVPDVNSDQIVKSTFDAANRKTSETDPLNYTDQYKPDALGNIILHTDRAGNGWVYQYDRANRLESDTTPSVNVTMVEKNVVGQLMKLTYKEIETSIINKKSLDRNSNEKQVIKAFNSPSPRTLSCGYNKRNQLIETSLTNVLVDDENKPGNFDNPPVKTVELKTQIIYNAKKLKVAEQNESGCWTFSVYDAEANLAYTINPAGFVTQFKRNTFGEVIEETAYATVINLNLSQYTKSGVPFSVMQQPGIIIASAEDRSKSYQRDHRGDTTLIKQGEILYYLFDPDAEDEKYRIYDWGKPEVKRYYNAFRQCVHEAVLLNPKNQTCSQQLFWFDRNGRKIAECDPVYRVIRYAYDSFGSEIARVEWANKPKPLPVPTTTLQQLDANHDISADDRTTIFDHDLAGQCIKKMTKQVVIQQVTLGEKNVPSMQDLPPQDLTQQFAYNALRQQIAVTYEDGSVAYNWYDALSQKIAVTDVLRKRADNGDNIIPLTYLGYDYFGQQARTTRFKSGTASVSPDRLPDPIAIDADHDQTELNYFDNRGLMAFSSNAETNVTGFTYTPTRKTARQYYLLTNHDAKHIDEKRFTYDVVDLAVLSRSMRDNQAVITTAFKYNAFRNRVAQGPGDNTWPVYSHFDTLNHCWSTNEKGGVNTISLTNMAGQITAEIQSPTRDLSVVTYDQLKVLLDNKDKKDELECDETERDAIGQKIKQAKPGYNASVPVQPVIMPLGMVTGNGYPEIGQTSVSWVLPQEKTVTPKFYIWPEKHPEFKKELEIKTVNDRCGVDVSSLATDVYEYEIKDYFTNPVTGQPESDPLFYTQGRVQFITNNNANSLQPVISVMDGSKLYFYGNTQGLTSIELLQYDQRVATVNVQSQNGKVLADLSGYESGVYTLIPNVTGKNNSPASLPFTIYTATPPKTTLLSKEIITNFSLKYLESGGVYYVQLIWEVAKEYDALPVRMECTYIDALGDPHIFRSSEITRQTNRGTVEDKHGNILVANTIFHTRARAIKDLTLRLEIPHNTLIIANKATPDKVTGDGVDLILDNAFVGSTVLYIVPVEGLIHDPVLAYLDTSMDILADWKEIKAIDRTKSGIVIDVTDMAPCIYPFKLVSDSNLSSGNADKIIEGVFTVTQGKGVVYNSNNHRISTSSLEQKIKYYEFTHDHWHNLTMMQNTNGAKTDFTYNFNNDPVLQTQPAVYYLDSRNKIVEGRPAIKFGYNARGFRIGEMDPNGNTQAFLRDAAGQEIELIVGDGTIVRQQNFNALAQRESHIDARGYTWKYQSNRLNSIFEIAFPSGNTRKYTWNELNHRSCDIDEEKFETKYDYDTDQNISRRHDPIGYMVDMQHDRNAEITSIAWSGCTHPYDNEAMSWERNFFGRENSHTDLAKVKYHYFHDMKGQKTRQTSEKSQRMDRKAVAVATPQYIGHKLYDTYEISCLPENGALSQELNFKYTAGLLAEVTDSSMKEIKLDEVKYNYGYDSEMHPTSLSISSGEILLRQIRTHVDNLSRDIWSTDSGATVVTLHDAAGNRKQVTVDGVPNTEKTEVNYIFDNANRVIYDSNTDLRYIHEHGFRIREEKGNSVYKLIGYDDDGLLTSCFYPEFLGKNNVTTLRTYKKNRALLSYTETESEDKSPYFSKTLDYYFNGLLKDDVQVRDGKLDFSTNYISYSNIGLPINYNVNYPNKVQDAMTNTYAGYDDKKLAKVSGLRHIPEFPDQEIAAADRVIDPNGVITFEKDLQDVDQPNEKMDKLYTTTFDGTILMRDNYQKNRTVGRPFTERKSRSRYFCNTRKELIASYGIDIEDENYQVIVNYLQHCTNRKSSDFKSWSERRDSIKDAKSRLEAFKAESRAPHLFLPDFMMTYPAPVPERYTVSLNDTFTNIAMRVYGDSGFASAIAGMNGFSLGDKLFTGQVLKLPQYLPNTNSANNHTPYEQFLGIMIGRLYPHFVIHYPAPQKQKKGGGGLVGQVVHAIVDTVAAVVGGFFGGPAGAAVLVALADAAYQEVAVKVHWQDHFSLASAVTAGLEAGVATGLLRVSGGSLNEMLQSISGKEASELIMKTGEIAVANQLIEMKMGMRDKFDFSAVATDVVGAVAIYRMAPVNGNNMNSSRNFMHDVMLGGTQSVISGGLHAAVSRQRMDIEMLAANALGTAIGRRVGESMLPSRTEVKYREVKKEDARAKLTNGIYGSAVEGAVNAFFDNEFAGAELGMEDFKQKLNDLGIELDRIRTARTNKADRWNANVQKIPANKFGNAVKTSGGNQLGQQNASFNDSWFMHQLYNVNNALMPYDYALDTFNSYAEPFAKSFVLAAGMAMGLTEAAVVIPAVLRAVTPLGYASMEAVGVPTVAMTNIEASVAGTGIFISGAAKYGSKLLSKMNLFNESSMVGVNGISELDLLRRNANTGVFSDLKIPMQHKIVQRIAREAGVGLDGINIKIIRDPDLLKLPYLGRTTSKGEIELYPNAFSDIETLVKTLGHERTHVYQVKSFGHPDTLMNGFEHVQLNERAAYTLENSYWQYYQTNKSGLYDHYGEQYVSRLAKNNF